MSEATTNELGGWGGCRFETQTHFVWLIGKPAYSINQKKRQSFATQKATLPFATPKGASDHQCFRLPGGDLKPFHAQEVLPNSSSWFDQVPNFRQEIRQSHYRNDPVKYDLALVTKSFESL